MRRFKIFTGPHAEEIINKWLENNPNTAIIDWKYQISQKSYWHSIVVFYEEIPQTQFTQSLPPYTQSEMVTTSQDYTNGTFTKNIWN